MSAEQEKAHDLFRPPKASLDVPPAEKGPRPQRVKVAVWLLLSSAGLNVLLAIMPWVGAMPILPGETPYTDLTGTSFNVVLLGLIAWKMWQGRNWARWLLLVLGILGVIGTLTTIAFVPQAMKILSGLRLGGAIVQTALQCTVIVLAFTGESRDWFRRD